MSFLHLIYIKFLITWPTITPPNSSLPKIKTFTGNTWVVGKLWSYLTEFLWLGATIASLLLLYAVFMLVTSLGETDKYTKAKKTLINFGIGWFLLTISYSLVRIATLLFK